ncbi:MAG: hypothetical protein QME66_04705 [Candidatus Eisenbacteria bacterium]|nr:hypothetical protein [Candidatus Eisenbacteria bacterium]
MPAQVTDKMLRFVITADDQSKAVFALSKQHMQDLKSTSGSMSASMMADIRALSQTWVGTAAKIYGAYYTIKKGWDMLSEAADFEEQKDQLNALAGQYGMTANSIINDMVRASNGMLSISDAAKIAGEGLQKHLTPDQLIKLAKATVTLADFMKTNAKGGFDEAGGAANNYAEALDRIFHAIVRGSPKGLKQAIGAFDLKEEGEYNKTLTAREKVQGLLQIALSRTAELEKSLGVQQMSTKDKMEMVEAQAKNLRLELGTNLLAAAKSAWSILGQTPTVVIEYLQTVRQEVEQTREATMDPDPFMQFGIFCGIWGQNIVSIFKMLGVAISALLTNAFLFLYASIRYLWDMLVGLGQLIIGVFTLDLERIRWASQKMIEDAPKAWYTTMRASGDALVEHMSKSWKKMWHEFKVGVQKDTPSMMTMGSKDTTPAPAWTDELKGQAIMAIKGRLKLEEAAVAYEEKINKAALERCEIGEVEAIQRRFAQEKKLYDAHFQAVADQIMVEKQGKQNLEKIKELEGELLFIDKERGRLAEYEALEIELLQIENLKKMKELEEERLKTQMESYSAAWTAIEKTNALIEGDLGEWMSRFNEAGKTLAGIWTNTDAYAAEEKALADHYNARLNLAWQTGFQEQEFWQIMNEWELAEHKLKHERMVQIAAAYAQAAMALYGAIEAYRSQARIKAIAEMQARNNAASVADQKLVHKGEMTQKQADERQYARDVALHQAKIAQEKEAFQIQKAYAMLNAAINTAVAITKALPNIPLAIAVGIMGAAQIAAIASQQYVAPAPPTMRETEVVEPPIPSTTAIGTTTREITVNYHIYGNVIDHDAFARETVPSILKAIKDGVH